LVAPRYSLAPEGDPGKPRTMQQALSEWWHAAPTAPAVHYLPCELKDTAPHGCNPSCLPDGQTAARAPPPPPAAATCTPCTDEPTAYMLEHDKACATWAFWLARKCSGDADFTKAGACRRSCFEAGTGSRARPLSVVQTSSSVATRQHHW
jgi:hypothetical protein